MLPHQELKIILNQLRNNIFSDYNLDERFTKNQSPALIDVFTNFRNVLQL